MPWPKKFSAQAAPLEMLNLVGRLMPLLLAADHSSSPALREQYARARIVSVELTGVGFFVEFAVPRDAPRAEPRDLIGGRVFFQVQGLEHGAECALVVRDGVIDSLQGCVYGDDEWPERPVVVSLSQAVALVPRIRSAT